MTQSAKAYPFLGSNQEEFIQSLKNSVVPVPIIFATQTQTCKQLANQLARYFQSGQIKAKIIDVAALTPEDLSGPFFVYLTCTFFMGDHPKSALQFVSKLRENDPVWAEAIKSKYFSVFGIGSLKYKLFCKASDELDTKFTELGANRVMRVSRVDRNVPQGYEPQFQEWMKDLLDNMGIDKVEESQSLYETKVQSKYPFIAPPKNYFWCKLLERKQLSDNVVDGIQHYYKFELPATNPYKAGQHIAIMPRNHRYVMNQVFQKVAFLSIIPSFALMNSISVGFNIGYFNASISEGFTSGNYILLQLVLQVVYIVLLVFIALLLDKSLMKSTSKIQPTNVTEPPTEKQKQSSVYGFGVEKMKTQAHEEYCHLNNKEADNKKMLHGDYQEIDYAPQTYTNGSQGVLIYNVSKDYKSKKQVIRANKNVNLLINNNEIFGVLGPNGSGKTTLCKAVMMAQTIDSGDIVVNGLSIRSDFKEVQKKIGICLQNDAGLFEELTVIEHLQFYKAICTNPSEIDFLAQFQLEEHKDKRAKELSGGWKRRLSVACALQNNPDILILDEITSGVDAVAREELWKLLKEICRDKTIIATTHTLHEAQTYFDRVAFIMNGQIVCCGKVDDITNLYKNKICLEVRGLLPKSFFPEMKELDIIVEDNQVVGQRIQMLEAQCQDNVEILFQHLNEYQEHKIIESFSITQRQFDQVFYELIRVCE